MDGDRLSTFSTNGLLALLALACVIACAGSLSPAQADVTLLAIGQMAIGAAPNDFDFARTGQGGIGKWVVVADQTARDGRAIEQSSMDTTDYRFPLAIYQVVSAQNVEVSVRFKPVSGRVDQAGGIAVRLIDPNNYYVVRANALEDNVRFYRVVNGRREQLEGANLKVASNAWHTLALKAEGERFTVTFNGKQLYTATDRTFAAAGKVALWTKADSVTRFDQVEIKTLP